MHWLPHFRNPFPSNCISLSLSLSLHYYTAAPQHDSSCTNIPLWKTQYHTNTLIESEGLSFQINFESLSGFNLPAPLNPITRQQQVKDWINTLTKWVLQQIYLKNYILSALLNQMQREDWGASLQVYLILRMKLPNYSNWPSGNLQEVWPHQYDYFLSYYVSALITKFSSVNHPSTLIHWLITDITVVMRCWPRCWGHHRTFFLQGICRRKLEVCILRGPTRFHATRD